MIDKEGPNTNQSFENSLKTTKTSKISTRSSSEKEPKRCLGGLCISELAHQPTFIESGHDQRGFFEQRPLSLRLSEDGDSVECLLGKTRVSAHVSANLVKPKPDRPFEGLFHVSSEINPLASSAFESGRSSEDEVQVARILEKTLTRGGVVDREALCILAGQIVWSIRMDLHFLNDQGNLLDCASIAAMAALQTFCRPDVSIVGEEVTLHSIHERVPVPLTLHHSPLCVTFAFFKLPTTVVLMDPSLLEEQLSIGTITLALNPQKEICVVNMSGGLPLDIEEVMRLVTTASKKVREIDESIKKLAAQQLSGIDLAAVQDR
ncbi:hypothetical protein O181_022788 [Austropuccinia psidii MF-1]|uniref:Exosome complex component RRP45 n=1 Tax=Austropuccinia psidii MF-1 TaxID=1389203 RepID=A0A9Q3CHL6_9BASI|nr:hypothetical protein [Austropuccinia psidii MF-1]